MIHHETLAEGQADAASLQPDGNGAWRVVLHPAGFRRWVRGHTTLPAGKQVATAEKRIVGPDWKVYAPATTTCLIFDQPTA